MSAINVDLMTAPDKNIRGWPKLITSHPLGKLIPIPNEMLICPTVYKMSQFGPK